MSNELITYSVAIKITELPDKFVIEIVEQSGDVITIYNCRQRNRVNNIIADIQQVIFNSGYFKLSYYGKQDNIQIYEYKTEKPVWEYKQDN